MEEKYYTSVYGRNFFFQATESHFITNPGESIQEKINALKLLHIWVEYEHGSRSIIMSCQSNIFGEYGKSISLAYKKIISFFHSVTVKKHSHHSRNLRYYVV